MFEEMSGARMFPSCWRIGGIAHDLNEGFEEHIRDIFKKISCNMERFRQSY